MSGRKGYNIKKVANNLATFFVIRVEVMASSRIL